MDRLIWIYPFLKDVFEKEIDIEGDTEIFHPLLTPYGHNDQGSVRPKPLGLCLDLPSEWQEPKCSRDDRAVFHCLPMHIIREPQQKQNSWTPARILTRDSTTSTQLFVPWCWPLFFKTLHKYSIVSVPQYIYFFINPHLSLFASF